MTGRRVRETTLTDCGRVAEIRVRSRQSAYRGLVPQPYLDRLSVVEDAERRRTHLTRSDGGVHDRLLRWVVQENSRARRFYERAGLRADGAEELFEVEGATVPEVRYTRALRR
ncbi:hypothetical protein [Streptomyces djakartensis]|uniref:N-acetyltransferase n=1 Tax=Streptomyces djakartensis TaxID=68193 RepID=A0ABQ2ZEU2_9ACTN|nr:hypothetical protein [Streptomyces djakartensis]GGY14640.1 N-acetyltransferase [Streptomyces djakartensis]